MIVSCEFCGHEFRDVQPGTFQHAAGWLPRRTAGGANAIALPELHPRFACATCIDRQRHGVSPTQGDLFA